ncbi:hypothetical protein H6G96_26070 [Nostoc sp. FACHB-892]|uniref:hypothetical protein n=1 Tax=Nostoc sp. FACHB-892 TaxID=2692843 RepID=UPI001686D024|nr:hypothetical protein [Nostoc sp. FACHB-892]MBD2729688.1 hypothetical protein [Nostoc sp. FACHB-892]
MSNYLFDLIAKSFNLIDTVQPLVLSVFEPLPESTLGWESSITTESTELKTTSQAEGFPSYEIVQSLEWRSPATNLQISEEITNPLLTNLTSASVQSSQQILKSIPNLAYKPDLELSSNWPFLESVPTQISTDNQQLVAKTEGKTSTTPLNFDTVLSSQNQLIQINPIISFAEPSNLVNLEPFFTQTFLESKTLSTPVNQIISHFNTELLKPALLPQTKISLSNHLISVQARELNTSFSDPISRQSQLIPKSLVQQLIDIDHLGLFLQLPIKPDLQVPFNEHPIKPVIFPFAPQEKTFLQSNLNTTILRTAIAKENNAPVSKLVGEKSEKLINQLLNNQSIEISRAVSLYPLLKVLYFKQSLSQIQPETTTILSIPNVIEQGKSVTENLHRQPTEINPVFTHSQLPLVESYEAFPSQLQSELTAIPLVSFANVPTITQLSPLTPALAVETNTHGSTLIQPQEQLVTESLQKQSLQSGNISTSEILSRQIVEQPTAILSASFANASAINQESPLIPTITIKTNTPNSTLIQPQEQLVNELPQKRSLQINRNPSSAQIQQLMGSQLSIPEKPINNAPVINQILPTNQKTLKLGLTVETSTPALSSVIHHQEQPASKLVQQQLLQIPGNVLSLQVQKLISPQLAFSEILEEPVAIPTLREPLLYETLRERGTVSSANASIIDSTLLNLHKQSLVPTIAQPQEKIMSDVPETQQKFAHKNVSSMQPLLPDASAKLSSPQTNSSIPPFVDNLPSSVTSQLTTQLTAINSDIVPTPALHPSTVGTDIQSQVNFSNSHLSDFHTEKASDQEVRSQNHNKNYHKHIAIQKVGVVEQCDELEQAGEVMNINYAHYPANMQCQQINPNEGTLTSAVENLILPQNVSPNLSMSADRGRDRVESSYFRQLEESDLRPLSEPINDLNVKNLSVIAHNSKKAHKRWRSPSQTSPQVDTPPAIQVTIGKLEIRSAAPAPPPPRSKPRPAPSVMSLNEYLQRRARRG